jgi:hypothetical protein
LRSRSDRDKFRICWVKLCCLKSPWLIHIDPDSIKLELFVEVTETNIPHFGAVGVKPVNEYSYLWPHLIDQVVVVGLILVKT